MTTWYVRTGGSDTNGGSSNGNAAERTGTDGATTTGTTTFVSASANFVAGDVGKGIYVGIGAATKWRKINAVTNSTTVTLSGATITTASGLTWAIGGAWLTIACAVGTNSPVADGETIYVGAGTYRISAAIAPLTHASMTYLTADVDGSHAGDPGEVIVTNYATNDTSSATNVNTFLFNAKSFWTLSGFTLVSGAAVYNLQISGASHDLAFLDCTILNQGVSISGLAHGVSVNFTFERCRIWAMSSALSVACAGSATGADYNLNLVVSNCFLFSGSYTVIFSGSATTYRTDGAIIRNCTIIGYTAAYLNGANFTNMNYVYNCACICWSWAIGGGSTYKITEDYNWFWALGTTQVVSGEHSKKSNASAAPLLSLGQEAFIGSAPRPFLSPLAGSPLLGFGSDASVSLAVDLNGNPRPAGGASALKAVGAYERGNTFGKETGTVRTGTNAVSITGPGYQDFAVPVAASSTTFTVYGRYDATYAGALPTLSVLKGEECGVTPASDVMAGAADQWEALTLTIVPTSAGIVTVRLQSNDTNGGGKAIFDDWSVA